MDLDLDLDQIQQNTEILTECIQSKPLRRRIQKEIEKMYPAYAQIVVSFDPNKKGNRHPNSLDFNMGELTVTIREIVEDKIQAYEFVIPLAYPFVPPKIRFQSRPYIDFLKLNYSASEFQVFRRITNQQCFCCHSLNCGDNWSPSITLEKIIDEIRWIKSVKRRMIHKLLADKIKARYLIEDIDLDSWLQ